MKTFKINISSKLENVEITVKNGAHFSKALIQGEYSNFEFKTNELDAERIKKFAIKYADDKSSNMGCWYAHCNGFAMDLIVLNSGKNFQLNTYRPYGKSSK